MTDCPRQNPADRLTPTLSLTSRRLFDLCFNPRLTVRFCRYFLAFMARAPLLELIHHVDCSDLVLLIALHFVGDGYEA